MRYSSLFLPCGTMFPRKFFFAGHVATSQALDTRASNESGRYGWLDVHAITIRARALNHVLTIHLVTRGRIRSFRSSSDGRNKRKAWVASSNRGATRGRIMSFWSSSNRWNYGRIWTASWATIPPVFRNRTALISSWNGRSTTLARYFLININKFSSST